LFFNNKCSKNDSKGVSYIWDTAALKKIIPESYYTNEDAIILDRKIEVKLPAHKKFGTIFNIKNMYISKTDRILINIDNAVQYYTHMVLPEDLDPLLNWTYRNFAYNYLGAYNVTNEYRIMHLSVRIIKKDGHIFIPELREKEVIDSVFYDVEPIRRMKHHFNLSPLLVGDEIQIHYKIELPVQYSVGNQNRFVFNEKYPIQNYTLTVSYAQWTRPLITMGNGAETAYDSTMFIEDEIDKTKMIWKRNNLSAYEFNNPFANIDAVPYVDFSIFEGLNGGKGFYENITAATNEGE